MPKLEWLGLARADLLAIVDYISDDNPDAAQRVKDDIEEKVAKLPDFPKIGRVGKLYHRVPRRHVYRSNTSRVACGTTVATIPLNFINHF